MGRMESFIQALPAIANALGDSFGVQVLTGSHACTNGKQIFLPPLDVEKPETKVLGLGWIVHESSHVRYTNFSARHGSPLEDHVSNILEDVRCEKCMFTDFPGTEAMVQDLRYEMVKQNMYGKPEDSKEPTEFMLGHMLFGLRYNILHQGAFAEYAEKAKELAAANLPKGMFTRLTALMYQVEQCESTEDVQSLTKSILKMMEDEAKKEEEKARQEQQSKSQDQEAGQQQSQPQSGNGQDQDDQNDQQDGQDASQGQGGQAEQPVGDQQQDGSSSGSGAAPQSKEAEAIRSILAAGDDDWADDGETLAKMLDGASDPSCPSAVSPFKHKKAQEDRNADAVGAKARVAGASNALRYKMQNLLQARTFKKKGTALSGTKLDFKSLHRAPLMGPIFATEKKATAIDTAISLLVDISGSMNGEEPLAMDAALATMMAFQTPDVATAAYAFPNPHAHGTNAVLKSWQEQPTAAICRNATMHANGGTPMAEALFGVGIDICKRREKRKIILVLTDGDPDDKPKTKYVIEKARKTGIEVLGLGIKIDVSRMFGKEFSGQISDISTLPQTMIGMLGRFV